MSPQPRPRVCEFSRCAAFGMLLDSCTHAHHMTPPLRSATYMIRDGGKSAPHKGYGFVVFKKAASADAAMEALNGNEHTPPMEICGQVTTATHLSHEAVHLPPASPPSRRKCVSRIELIGRRLPAVNSPASMTPL